MAVTAETLALSWSIVVRSCTEFLHGSIESQLLEDLNKHLGTLQHFGVVTLLKSWLADTLRQFATCHLVVEFCQAVDVKTSSSPLVEEAPSLQAVYKLHGQVKRIISFLNALSHLLDIDLRDLQDELLITVEVSALEKAPDSFMKNVQLFFANSLTSHCSRLVSDMSVDDEEEKSEEEQETGCFSPEKARAYMNEMAQFTTCLGELRWLPSVVGKVVFETVEKEINEQVKIRSDGEYKPVLSTLLEWVDMWILPWMELVAPQCYLPVPDYSEVLTSWKNRLHYLVHKSFATVRISEMFDVIVAYPSSKPVVEDLCDCLEMLGSEKSVLITTLRSEFESRLLQPSAHTEDIILQYASSVLVLRLLDKTGVVLEKVCEPLRHYLRNRSDTVRRVVEDLVCEGGGDLGELAGSVDIEESDLPTAQSWRKWQPNPVDADSSKSSFTRMRSDVISLLVSIYGSKNLFMNEYRGLLAERLLEHLDYDIEREYCNLERLKLRFTDADFTQCETMLRDFDDSRRINSHIHSVAARRSDDEDKDEEKEDFWLDAVILSRLFWKLPNEPPKPQVVLPERVTKMMDVYQLHYQTHKVERSLIWKTSLGRVDLELEFPSGSVSFEVNPTQASAISLLEDQPECPRAQLADKLGLPENIVQRQMTYWVRQGIVREQTVDNTVVYQCISDLTERGDTSAAGVVVFDDMQEVAAKGDENEKILRFWQYTHGVLMNLGAMPIERLHQMMKFAIDVDSDDQELTMPEFKTMLDLWVRQGDLNYGGGMYCLPD